MQTAREERDARLDEEVIKAAILLLLIMILLMIFPPGFALPQDQDHDQEHEQETSASVMLRAEEMERDVRLIADDPTVVPGPDVEKIAGFHFVIAAVVHLAGG